MENQNLILNYKTKYGEIGNNFVTNESLDGNIVLNNWLVTDPKTTIKPISIDIRIQINATHSNFIT